MTSAPPRLLLLETSNQPGLVGLAEGQHLLSQRRLESGRHNARDLAPAVAELLGTHAWKATDLEAVVVGRGPGSYTGLRVGVMTAKTLAYVTKCRLIAIDTFMTIAAGAPQECDLVEVVADAQKDSLYAQAFQRQADGWHEATPLGVVAVADWLAGRDPKYPVSGPGLLRYRERLPADADITPVDCWLPTLESLLAVAWPRVLAQSSDDPFSLEPLYLRASSAELQWQQKRPSPQPRSDGV